MTSVRIVTETQTRELRRAVLRPHLGPDDPLPGDDMPQGVHFAALDEDGTVVCTCFVYPDPCPWLPGRAAVHLRQMATLPTRRGEGHGRAVVEAAAHYAAGTGAQVFWCYARETAIGFYQRAGFAVHGGVFTDAQHTIAHRRMWRELPGVSTSSTR